MPRLIGEWDLVWIGCGAAKRAERSPAIELYTGPVFAAHRAIADHLDLHPQILSAAHGVVEPQRELDPYDQTLDDAEHRARWSAGILEVVRALTTNATRGSFVGYPDIAIPLKSRPNPWEIDYAGAVGPAVQPSILVLAGSLYIDGWIDEARALGVRVDDPLRGLSQGERRAFAADFVRRTRAWGPGEHGLEEPGSRRDQLLAAVAEYRAARRPRRPPRRRPAPPPQIQLFEEVAAHG